MITRQTHNVRTNPLSFFLLLLQDVLGGVMKVAADPAGGLLVTGNVQGAQLRIQSLPGWQDTPWSEGGWLQTPFLSV
jgi:hypothetical protein